MLKFDFNLYIIKWENKNAFQEMQLRKKKSVESYLSE